MKKLGAKQIAIAVMALAVFFSALAALSSPTPLDAVGIVIVVIIIICLISAAAVDSANNTSYNINFIAYVTGSEAVAVVFAAAAAAATAEGNSVSIVLVVMAAFFAATALFFASRNQGDDKFQALGSGIIQFCAIFLPIIILTR